MKLSESRSKSASVQPPWKRVVMVSSFALVVSLVMASPAFAQLEPIENMAEEIADLLTGTFARTIAVIAIAVTGFMCYRGRFPWGFLISVVVGIAIVFGAAEIVDGLDSSI